MTVGRRPRPFGTSLGAIPITDRDRQPTSADEDPGRTFPERVWEIVTAIPPGRVTTYGTIATVLGDRRAARTVGWALHSCPEEVGEHAHRVVNRYGELSGGWSWGHPDIMRHLLESEGVTFVDEYRVDLDKHLWIPPVQDNTELRR